VKAVRSRLADRVDDTPVSVELSAAGVRVWNSPMASIPSELPVIEPSPIKGRLAEWQRVLGSTSL